MNLKHIFETHIHTDCVCVCVQLDLARAFKRWLYTIVESSKEVYTVDRITAKKLAKEIEIGKDKVIDIRKETEYAAEYEEKGYDRTLAAINDWIKILTLMNIFYSLCRLLPQNDYI